MAGAPDPSANSRLLEFRPAPDRQPRLSGRTRVVPLLAVVAIGLAVASLTLWLRARPAGAITADRGHTPVLHLESFVLNLNDPDGRAYLRAGVDLGLERPLTTDPDRDGFSVAQVRDTILSVLATGNPQELLTPGGKLKLKQQILRALREQVPGLRVREVYFTEFLIQQ